MRKSKRKKKPPSQCKQAVAQSSETIRTKNLSYLEKKSKKGLPRHYRHSQILISLKIIIRFRRKGLVFHSQFFIQRGSFQTNTLNTFLKQNLSYFLFGPPLKNSETPFALRKNLRSVGKKKEHAVSLKRKKESQLGVAISENAIQIGGLVEIPHGILCTV